MFDEDLNRLELHENTKKTNALLALIGIRKYRIEFGHWRPGKRPLDILYISHPFNSKVTKTVTIIVPIK